MQYLICPKCAEAFRVKYYGTQTPGGQEREDIDCPSCGHTVDSVVTSQCVSTVALTPEETALHKL